MKKVLVITNRYYQRAGGIERHVHAVNTSLSQAGYEVLHVCFDPHIEKEEKVNANYSIKVVKTPFLFGGFYPIISVSAAIKMRRAMLTFKPDVVHTHNRYMLSTIAAQILALFQKIPIAHTEHASSSNTFTNPLLNAISFLLDKTIIAFLLHQCQVVTVVSEAAARYLIKNFKIRYPLVIKNFIDTDEIDAIIKNVPNKARKATETECIFVGRLVETKGYHVLLKLLDLNQKNITGFNFTIIGGGPGEQQVRQAVALHDNVRYFGELTHEKTIRNLYQSDIYINLSSLEGLSTTIMEAMYLKKVIIATNIAPNSELLSNYPLAVMVETSPSAEQLLASLASAQKKMDIRTVILPKIPTITDATKGYLTAYSVAFPSKK